VAAGLTKTFTVTVNVSGTFMYEAGLTPGGGRQVVMGLAGPLIVEDGTAPTWDQDVVLVLNEIDPAFNINPLGFSMNRFRAKFWLINGQAYPDTGWIDVLAGYTILMRYLNAGVDDHTLGLLGLDQSVIALDGEPLPFPQGAVAPAIAPGQTLEALVQVPVVANDTLYPLYNASLHQHNNNQRLADGRAAFGGMLTFLKVTTGAAPTGGPVASNVTVAPQKTNGTEDVLFSATLTDPDLVAAYETFVDAVGAPGTGTLVSVTPAVSPVDVSVTFAAADVATWGSGEHILYIRGQDLLGAWGPLGSAVLNLDMAGPDILGLSLAPNPTNGGVDVVLSGTADDHTNGGSNVVDAQYSIDGGAWQTMILSNPGTPLSGLTATIPAVTVVALPEGQRLIEVQAQDDLLNWTAVPGAINLSLDKTGPTSTVTLSPATLDFDQALPVTSVRLTATIEDPLSGASADVQSTVVNAEGFLYTQGLPGEGFNLYPSDGLFDEVSETAYYNIPVSNFATLPTGDYQILVVGKDKAGNWGPAGAATLHVDAQVPDTTGPGITDLAIDVARNGRRFDLTATATDTQSNVISAVWFDTTEPDVTYPMEAEDGAFDSLTEVIEALRVDISDWPAGNYEIGVAAIDAAGNWGPTVTINFTK
jgi:hypothetical protein